MAPNAAGMCFPIKSDLADILRDADFDFGIFILGMLWIQDFQIPRFPDTAARRTPRSQPDPSPNAPKDQMGRKEPLLRFVGSTFGLKVTFGGLLGSRNDTVPYSLGSDDTTSPGIKSFATESVGPWFLV